MHEDMPNRMHPSGGSAMNIIISGVGGQGTILASKILAAGAVLEGRNARTGETIGMSQRGGCVVSHVRTGNIHSAYIPAGKADLLLSFEIIEGARCIPQLKKDGQAIINTTVITPVSATLGKTSLDVEKVKNYISQNSHAVFVDADSIAKKCGSVKASNTVLIGVAFGLGVLDLSRESLIQTIQNNVKPKFFDLNVKAFNAGVAACEGVEYHEKHG